MARGAITLQNISLSGITPSFAAAASDGDGFLNTGDTYLQIKNGSGADITAAMQTPAKIDGIDIAEITVVIPATTGNKIIGPFETHIFNQSDGKVYVDYTAVTTVTVAAFKLR